LQKLPVSVIHYGRFDPRKKVGGVETFARNLDLVFRSIDYMTPDSLDIERVQREQLMVICDNQYVTDWPDMIPVVGYQHGVAAVKSQITRKRSDRIRARRQAAAAVRPNTMWVANSRWVSEKFSRLHGNGAAHVIYYQVDVERFDGIREEVNPRLIVHDARTLHKGRRLIARLKKKFPAWQFEPLACEPADVPNRLRGARAFLHLSRYEGNSVVCNEAMAMDMPCMFTTVGLFNDDGAPVEVFRVDADRVYRDKRELFTAFDEFSHSLETRTYQPRAWTLANASPDVHREGWRLVVSDFAAMSGWNLELEPRR